MGEGVANARSAVPRCSLFSQVRIHFLGGLEEQVSGRFVEDVDGGPTSRFCRMADDNIDGLPDGQLSIDYFDFAPWHHGGLQVQHFLHDFHFLIAACDPLDKG